jgi:unspecific monooxygenase
MVVHMLVDAYRDGRLTEKQFKDNLKIVFLTAHENAQQLVNSMFWEIGKNTVCPFPILNTFANES